MNNVMIDLETWGTTPGSAIRSIGAVSFDPYTDKIDDDTFYFNISDQSCTDAGLIRQPGTVQWWSQQTQQAQDALVTDQKPLTDVITAFNGWFTMHRGVFVWGQGANFDTVLWESAASAVRARVPWRFYNVRDTRTAYDIAQFDPKSIKRRGTYHNALDDARHQAVCVQSCYKIVETNQMLAKEYMSK